MKVYIINKETLEFPIYEGDYREKYPDISYPQDFEVEEPYAWVYDSQYPENIEFSQGIREGTPVLKEDNIWYRVWEVYELSSEELTFKSAIVAQGNKTKAMKLLTETDWTQVADVNLQNKQEFTDYRAALRAIAIAPPVRPVEFPQKPQEIW